MNCTKLTYLSSGAIEGICLKILKRVKPLGGDLILTSLNPKVIEIFNLIGLTKFLTIADSIEQAIDILKSPDDRKPEVPGKDGGNCDRKTEGHTAWMNEALPNIRKICSQQHELDIVSLETRMRLPDSGCPGIRLVFKHKKAIFALEIARPQTASSGKGKFRKARIADRLFEINLVSLERPVRTNLQTFHFEEINTRSVFRRRTKGFSGKERKESQRNRRKDYCPGKCIWGAVAGSASSFGGDSSRNQADALPCGSVSMRIVRTFLMAAAQATLPLSVVLPVPPFWIVKATLRIHPSL